MAQQWGDIVLEGGRIRVVGIEVAANPAPLRDYLIVILHTTNSRAADEARRRTAKADNAARDAAQRNQRAADIADALRHEDG